jgi:curved DNA-binding protein CbpA
MTDYFALFGLPRRPWLDLEALKQRFHDLAAAHHPDVSGNTEKFAEVNAAYQVLRDPAARLRHLLELEYTTEAGSEPQIPPPLAERFMEVATIEREVHVFLHEQSTASSAVGRSLLAGERFAIQHDIERIVDELELDWSRTDQLLRVENSMWEQRNLETPHRLAQLQQEFAYLSKWLKQLRERLTQLESIN